MKELHASIPPSSRIFARAFAMCGAFASSPISFSTKYAFTEEATSAGPPA